MNTGKVSFQRSASSHQKYWWVGLFYSLLTRMQPQLRRNSMHLAPVFHFSVVKSQRCHNKWTILWKEGVVENLTCLQFITLELCLCILFCVELMCTAHVSLEEVHCNYWQRQSFQCLCNCIPPFLCIKTQNSILIFKRPQEQKRLRNWITHFHQPPRLQTSLFFKSKSGEIQAINFLANHFSKMLLIFHKIYFKIH